MLVAAIDDQPVFLSALAELAEREGVDFECAHDWRSLDVRLGGRVPDFVLLDHVLGEARTAFDELDDLLAAGLTWNCVIYSAEPHLAERECALRGIRLVEKGPELLTWLRRVGGAEAGASPA